MKKFERPSVDECRALIRKLHGKTAEEIIAMFGPPAHERGPRTEERTADGKPWVVEVRRSFVFYGVGKTIHRLGVVERADGKFEYHMQGREIVDENAV
jgi:hypothetical protein